MTPVVFEKVILIDDDPVLNHLNRIIIRKVFRPYAIDVISFDKPAEGFAYIAENCITEAVNTVLFLDINMPVLSGWDVLDKMCAIGRGEFETSFYVYTLILY